MSAPTLPSVAELTRGMSDEEKAALAGRVRAQAARLRTLRQYPTPLHLAAKFDRRYRPTAALEALSARLVEVANKADGRLLVSFPPREGKSTCLRAFCTWHLISEPDKPLVYASYGERLARTSGRNVRGHIQAFGESFGLAVSRDHADASDWQLEGHTGGMLSAGVGSALTGFGAGCLVIDDPHKDRKEADSIVFREAVWDWWTDVARTRLHKGASVIVVGTRWHPDDLIGRLLAEGWPLLNIPALADGKTPDALERESGTWMDSAQGRTPEDWAKTRADVGERTWAALYQGRPVPLEGGVFKAAWFDTWRVDALPAGCTPMTVVVDPADNEGDGDEAGILLVTTHPASGRVFIVDDLSAPMTVARWARLALLTCVRRDAPTLTYEQSLSGIPKKIREAWKTLHQQSVALHKSDMDPDAALGRLSRADDSQETRQAIEQGVAELTTDDVANIVRIGTSGPNLRKITAKGTKENRMMWAAPEFETGRAVIVGHLPALEYQARTWQVGMKSPDRVDAMVHATNLGSAVPASLGTASGERIPTRSTGRAPAGGARIGRSTGRRR